jgi:hypothetical protein
MKLSDTMAAIATGDAEVVDVTNRLGSDSTEAPDSTETLADYERQVALG